MIDPGAAPTVCFAAPPLAVFGCAKRSLRSHARINPSTQPSDVARGSRSKAAAELTLILCRSCRRLRSFDLAFVGAELAREGGLTAAQSFADSTRFNCRSEPARDSYLSDTVAIADVPKSLWELACQRWRSMSRPIPAGCTHSL
ncbi:hypothetical protein EMIT0P395_130139 [Pseudomonas sp. IT-P395]